MVKKQTSKKKITKKKSAKKKTSAKKSSSKKKITTKKNTTSNEMSKKEAKRERFLRLIPKRVDRIIDELRKLGNCSDTQNYTYSKEEYLQIIATIKKALSNVEKKFEVGGKSNKNFSFHFNVN
jgi:hypothetical protein